MRSEKLLIELKNKIASLEAENKTCKEKCQLLEIEIERLKKLKEAKPSRKRSSKVKSEKKEE